MEGQKQGFVITPFFLWILLCAAYCLLFSFLLEQTFKTLWAQVLRDLLFLDVLIAVLYGAPKGSPEWTRLETSVGTDTASARTRTNVMAEGTGSYGYFMFPLFSYQANAKWASETCFYTQLRWIYACWLQPSTYVLSQEGSLSFTGLSWLSITSNQTGKNDRPTDKVRTLLSPHWCFFFLFCTDQRHYKKAREPRQPNGSFLFK